MSIPSPQAENVIPSIGNNKVNSGDGYDIRFPPFPQPPDDVQVTPFSDFNEGGIRVNPGSNDTEVDSLGIPTVRMRIGHASDACKTNTKRKREEEEKKAGKETVRKVSKEWWDVWAEAEEIRYSVNFDPRSTRFERIQTATVDFTKDRPWPAQTKSETGPKFIWEKFLRYIGLPEGYMPIAEQFQSKKKKRELKEADDDSMSDDSDVEGNDAEPAYETRVDDGQTPSIPPKKGLSNEERLVFFLDNPEKSIQIFMSSYSWAKGYVWSEDNLLHIPHLLQFFVKFLMRSKVFPESDCERRLRRSLDAIKVALLELPNSASFMKLIPDKFGIGCNGCFGKKADGYSFANAGDDFPNTVVADTTAKLSEEPQEEPQVKKQKTDAENSDAADAQGGWGSASTGWGSGAGGWGDHPTDALNEWSSEQLEQLWESDEKEQPLFEFLGPSAFPLTHTTGVVERSMRRVKTILAPAPNPPPSQPTPEGGPNAMAVEIELDRNFSKLVLAPMPDWDNGEAPVYSKPTILASSRGPIIQTDAADDSSGTSAGVKPHDPLNGDITVLVESTQANLLREGMGVGGTWVQLVRQGDQVKKKKGKSKKPLVYWYLEEAAFITVSYWSYQ